MGMFGSVGSFFNGLKTPGADGISTADKLANLAASFGSPEDFATSQAGMAKRRTDTQSAAQKKTAMETLLAALQPQFQNAPQIDVGMPAPVAGTGTPDAVNLGAHLMSQDTAPPPMPDNLPETFLPRKTSDGLNINSPELPALALQAKAAGVDISSLLDVMKAQQPDIRYDRGYGYNGKTGASAGGYHPDLDKGQEPLYDSSGRIVGVRNVNGAVQSASEMAGAVKGAEAAAQAPYQPVQTFDQSGRPMTITAARLAGGANGQGAPFVGQSPAQTAADTARATAGANADIGLPQSQADAQQAVQLIESLKANPALRDRTGWKSLLPALPGTPGASFDAADEQLRGKLFLQAYAGLKGGGQITEVEGKKATQAIARLSRSQSPEDYTAALNDLETVIQSGLSRAEQQTGRMHPNANGGQGGSPGRAAIEAEMRRRGLLH